MATKKGSKIKLTFYVDIPPYALDPQYLYPTTTPQPLDPNTGTRRYKVVIEVEDPVEYTHDASPAVTEVTEEHKAEEGKPVTQLTSRD